MKNCSPRTSRGRATFITFSLTVHAVGSRCAVCAVHALAPPATALTPPPPFSSLSPFAAYVLGNYRLGNYPVAREHVDAILDNEPNNRQALSLRALIDDSTVKGAPPPCYFLFRVCISVAVVGCLWLARLMACFSSFPRFAANRRHHRHGDRWRPRGGGGHHWLPCRKEAVTGQTNADAPIPQPCFLKTCLKRNAKKLFFTQSSHVG